MKNEKNTISAEELDRRFDDGENISDFLDWENAQRPGLTPRRVNVDCPSWIVTKLDAEASRLGITRQSLIKVWIAEKLQAS